MCLWNTLCRVKTLAARSLWIFSKEGSRCRLSCRPEQRRREYVFQRFSASMQCCIELRSSPNVGEEGCIRSADMRAAEGSEWSGANGSIAVTGAIQRRRVLGSRLLASFVARGTGSAGQEGGLRYAAGDPDGRTGTPTRDGPAGPGRSHMGRTPAAVHDRTSLLSSFFSHARIERPERNKGPPLSSTGGSRTGGQWEEPAPNRPPWQATHRPPRTNGSHSVGRRVPRARGTRSLTFAAPLAGVTLHRRTGDNRPPA